MNRIVLVIGLLMVIPLLVFLAKAFDFDPGYVASPLIDQPAPDFTLAGLEGELIHLGTLAGKPVVINFWATYCLPCISEHKTLMAASSHYRDRVHFVGVIYQDDPELIRRFVTQRGAWGPSLVDPAGEVAIAYGVYGPPETFFIDRDGRIAEKVIGEVRPEVLVGVVEGLL